MTGRVLALLAVALVVAATCIVPDLAGEQLALFGFLAAPFKLIGKVGAAVVSVAKKVPRFVARTAPVIASSFLGVNIGGLGGAAPQPDFATPGIVPITQDFPVSSRFNLASTFEAILSQFRNEAEKLVERVTVKPRISGPLPVFLGIAGTVGVIGLLAGAVALARS